MTKKEFLKKLEDSLSANMTSNEVYSQINYYEDYISSEIKNGRTESEVLDELGDPTLIAKTIKQVNPSNTENVYNDNNTSENYSDNSYNTNDNYNTTDNYNRQNTNTTYRRYYDKTGLGCALFGIIILIIVFALLRFLGFIVGGTFIFFSPFSIIFLIIILFNIFRGRR